MKDDVIFKHVHVTVTPEKVETSFIFHKEDKKWWKFFTTFFFFFFFGWWYVNLHGFGWRQISGAEKFNLKPWWVDELWCRVEVVYLDTAWWSFA